MSVPLKERVQQLLENAVAVLTANGPDGIYERLLAEGCFGWVATHDRCPIACYIERAVLPAFGKRPLQVSVVRNRVEVWTVPMVVELACVRSETVKQFITTFDHDYRERYSALAVNRDTAAS